MNLLEAPDGGFESASSAAGSPEEELPNHRVELLRGFDVAQVTGVREDGQGGGGDRRLQVLGDGEGARTSLAP
jgi:hypothetical protein